MAEIKIAKVKPEIAPDPVIEGLALLREVARTDMAEIKVVAAIHTLDDAGIFAAIDEATEPARVGRCDCTPTWVGHMPGCPGDPAIATRR